MTGAALALGARIALGVMLVFSAVAKLRARETFRGQVGKLVGNTAAPAVAMLLPVTELVVAGLLVALWNPVPGVVALVLFAAFTGVLVRAQVLHVPCLCFGTSSLEPPAGPAAIVRNGVFMALAVLAVGSPSGGSLPAAAGLALVFGAVEAMVVRASA